MDRVMRHGLAGWVVLAVWAASACAGSPRCDGCAGQGTAGPPALGLASRRAPLWCLESSVPLGACLAYEISACPEVQPIGVDLKVSEPAGPALGTIVLGTGGPGATYYEDAYPAAVAALLRPAIERGYRVVQYAWHRPGWIGGPGGPYRLACRYATLVDAIRRELHTGDGPLCASGNSGAASEIAYALARYGATRTIDLALLTGGQPMARIDLGCLGEAGDPAWASRCRELHPCPRGPCGFEGFGMSFIESTYAGAEGEGRCSAHDPEARPRWLRDSVLSPTAERSSGTTEVRVMIGAGDCSEAAVFGVLYARELSPPAEIVFVPGAPHAVPSTEAGARAIAAELFERCVPRR